MTHYKVNWPIDIEADNPLEAAKQALEIHRDPNSIATFFKVTDVRTGKVSRVDLEEPVTIDGRLHQGQDRESYTDDQDRKGYTLYEQI